MKLININEYNDLELALMCLLGYLGVGVDRKNLLGSRYANVQSMVNQLIYGNIPKSTSKSDVDLSKVKKVLINEIPKQKDYEEYIEYIINQIKKEG